MTLEDLIKKLEQYPRDKHVVKGFCNPHCHRSGLKLAFEPCENTTAGAMLDCAKAILNNYALDVRCSLGFDGEWGEDIGETLLAYMLNDYA